MGGPTWLERTLQGMGVRKPPLSAQQIVKHATELLPQMPGTSRVHTSGTSADLENQSADVVSSALPELADECKAGVTLALVSLAAQRNRLADLIIRQQSSLPQSRHGQQAVWALYQTLDKNAHLRSLTLQGEQFCQEAGGGHLASFLNANTTLRELELVGGGWCGKAVWKAFETASNKGKTGLWSLVIGDHGTSGEEVTLEHLTAVLPNFSELTKLRLETSEPIGLQGFQNLAAVLELNAVLKELHIDCKGFLCPDGAVKALADALLRNTSLEVLTCYIPWRGRKQGLCQADADSLAGMLAANTTLKQLFFSDKFLFDERLVRGGLSDNTALNVLTVRLDKEGAEALLKLLTPHHEATRSSACPELHTLRLTLRDSHVDLKVLKDMIVSNRTVRKLGLLGAGYSPEEWATTILPAFRRNTFIRKLDLSDCPGVDVQKVYPLLLDLLVSYTSLEAIHLFGTPLHEAGKAESVQEEVRKNIKYRAALMDVPTTRPKSCRLVLCGYQFAGKTTLADTMLLLPGAGQGKLEKGPSTRYHVAEQDPTKARTRGFEVSTLLDQPDIRINIWDFAGHEEYYALHDCVFPNVHDSCIFVFAYNPMVHSYDTTRTGSKTYQHFTDEFEYWLRFVASNSAPRSSGPVKPFVVVVITHQDMNGEAKVDRGQVAMRVRDLKTKFQGVVEAHEVPFFVSALSGSDVEPIFNMVVAKFKDMLRHLPEVPVVCEQTRLALEKWSLEHDNKPIISVNEFRELFAAICKVGEEKGGRGWRAFRASDRSWKVVAAYLHDTGDVIYFHGLDFIVVNPHWFGHNILGNLVNQSFASVLEPQKKEVARSQPENGLVDLQFLQELLEESLTSMAMDKNMVSLDNLIDLMLKLDLCYLREWTDEAGVCHRKYFIPFLLEDCANLARNGERRLEWPPGRDVSKCIFVGQRLQCADTNCTYLTPGFFPRLQVVLVNHFASTSFTNRTDTQLRPNLFEVTIQGHDILLEYSGHAGYFVDILVRSVASHFQTVTFLQKNVITQIRSFCASQKGCIGVSLVEGVIRKECVKNLTLCKYRTNENILFTDLKKSILDESSGIRILDWRKIPHEQKGQPDILGPKTEYAGLIQNDIIIVGEEQEVKEAILGTSGPELPETPELDGPKVMYLTSEDVSMFRRFLAKVSWGRVVPFKLHLGCECTGCGSPEHTANTADQHRVPSQRGRLFYLFDERAMRMQPWSSYAYLCLCLAARVGSNVAGVGYVGDVAAAIPPPTRTAFFPLDIESFNVATIGAPRSQLRTEVLRTEVESFLQENPKYEWRKRFLNTEDCDRFRRHFRLCKVQYQGQSPSSSSTVNHLRAVAWICDGCREHSTQQVLQ